MALKPVGSLKPVILMWYHLSALTPSAKVRFVTILKGNKKVPGLVERLGGEFITPGCFLIPEPAEEEIRRVCARWGVKPSYKRFLTY